MSLVQLLRHVDNPLSTIAIADLVCSILRVYVLRG